MCSHYNLDWFGENIREEIDAVKFFQKFNIIPTSKLCSNKHSMLLCVKKETNYCFWQCKKGKCCVKISVRKDTWLEGTKLNLRKILKFIYCWTEELTSITFCNKQIGFSSRLTVDFNNYLREVSNCLRLG